MRKVHKAKRTGRGVFKFDWVPFCGQMIKGIDDIQGMWTNVNCEECINKRRLKIMATQNKLGE